MDILINITLFLMILTSVVYLLGYLFNKERFIQVTPFLFFVSFCSFMVASAFYSFKVKRIPLANQFESVMILCLGIFFISIYLYFKYKKDERIFFSSSVALIVMISLLNLIEPSMRPLMPALRSNWLFFHVLTSMFAYSFFLIAAAFSVFIFLKGKNFESKLDIILKVIKLGFAMLTLGIITGSVWAESAWGRYWSWDPKEIWSLITWFYYAGVIHISKKDVTQKKIGILCIIGILIVMFTYFGVNYLMSGLHSYA